MKYLYYPGCSQKATSRFYETAFLAVCGKLGVELTEIDDWNCCGATMAISCNKVLSLALAARNLSKAEAAGLPVVTPCPSCWLAFHKANDAIGEAGPLAAKVADALAAGDVRYGGGTEVRHALDFFVNVVGLDAIRAKVTAPLKGLRIAPYYGCQVIRPYAVGDDGANPQNLEKLIGVLGGQPADFPYRTACCGSSLMVSKKEIAETMSLRILKGIGDAGADAIVTPCGLCQTNLELAEGASRAVFGKKIAIPVLNLAQLIGLALGIPARDLGVRSPVVPAATAGERV
jgi:heterodisulfide reductase subunit B2